MVVVVSWRALDGCCCFLAMSGSGDILTSESGCHSKKKKG